jgi:cell division protein FtsB
MFGKLKKLIADLEVVYNLIQSHAAELEQLKADVEALKPKKKVTKPVVKKTTK